MQAEKKEKQLIVLPICDTYEPRMSSMTIWKGTVRGTYILARPNSHLIGHKVHSTGRKSYPKLEI